MEKGFTLVIPLYNKVKAVRTTLDSVLFNHGKYPFKCIIVDDDSTDGSSEIGEEYDVKYPDVFQYIKIKHHGNKTPVYARNLGIKLAETEYIGFLDADDELYPGFIDRGCGFLDEHPEYNLYTCGYTKHFLNEMGVDEYLNVYYSTDKTVINNFTDILASNICCIHFCASVYKTELTKQCLFGAVLCEDSVFQLEYCYKNLPVYVDDKITESIIYNEKYCESSNWSNYNTYSTDWRLEMILSFKNKSKCDDYDFWLGENNSLYYQKIVK